MPGRVMIFGPLTPGRASRGRRGPQGRYPPGAADTRPFLLEKRVKRKMQAAARPRAPPRRPGSTPRSGATAGMPGTTRGRPGRRAPRPRAARRRHPLHERHQLVVLPRQERLRRLEQIVDEALGVGVRVDVHGARRDEERDGLLLADEENEIDPRKGSTRLIVEPGPADTIPEALKRHANDNPVVQLGGPVMGAPPAGPELVPADHRSWTEGAVVRTRVGSEPRSFAGRRGCDPHSPGMQPTAFGRWPHRSGQSETSAKKPAKTSPKARSEEPRISTSRRRSSWRSGLVMARSGALPS